MSPPRARTPPAATLLELLETRADTHGETALYTFLEDGGDDAVLSYAGLELRARRIGAALQALSRAGERAVLLYPPGLEYIAGFFGCLYAGLVAVPAYPPDPMRLERTLPRLRAIIRDARASVVLTTAFIQEMGESLFEGAPELASLRWVATDALPEGTESGWKRPEPSPAWDTLAFLQYTSGSTGDPKGVQLSHGNLLHNLKLISHAFQVRDDSVGVIWLPPYHDMGLIGGILQPLYASIPVALMSPLAFLRRPRFWLEALTRFGGTISGGPCFAFDLCIRKVPPAEREGLDLRRWDLAFCGAEPIRPEVMSRFVEAFAPAGFQGGALYPCYGLAEGTLIASGGRKGEGVLTRTWDATALERNEAVEVAEGPGSRPLVGCGGTMPDQTLLVVDPETRRACPPERVGEVWVSGPSVAHGYWERPEESEAAFGATLEDDASGRRFLRTGDLGLLRDGELFVVGRRKDLIILRGRNLHPQDLELSIERSHSALRPGCGAAFSIEVEGEERLAVMYEVDTRKPWTPEELVAAVRRGLSEAHEVQLHTLVLIEPGALPKTSSGKIQRRACRAELLAGTARAVLTWRESDTGEGSAREAAPAAPAQPTTVEELETWLLARIAGRLRVSPETLARDVPITSFGLDSLGAVELANDVESLGTVLRMEVLLQGPTVTGLARTIFEAREATAHPVLARGNDEHPAPLSAAQQRLWLFEQLHHGSPAYHLPAALRLSGALNEPALESAFAAIVARHAALRATFREEDGTPSVLTAPTQAPLIRRVDLRDTPTENREAEALRLAREEARAPFDLATGPLLRLTLIRLDAHEHLLVVVMHHIVSDGGSFAILARELSALLSGTATLPPLPFQYPDFARWRRQLDDSASLEWWKQRLAGAPAALELPTDHARPPVPSYSGARVALHVPASLTARLEELGRSEGATLFMTLLAAFQVLLSRHSGQDDLCIGTPVNGRDRAGLEGLIGCFLELLVLRGSLAGAPRFRELLGRTREATLEAFAHRGVPFERVVDAVQPARDRSRAPLFQVLFVLQPEPGSSLALPGLEARRVDVDPGATPYDLTLSLARGADGLEGWLEYATDLFDAATASRLAQRLRVLLEAVVANPDERTSALSFLPEPERRQVLVEWNDTRTDFEDACIHTLIEARAARTPETVAVVCGDVELTWGALDRRANAVAWRLREQGVGPESIVGFCADRSVDLVVGLLGILKAGGAYLPLDPSYPEARLALMLEDAGAPVVLAHRHLASAFQASGRTVVLLDPLTGPDEAQTPPACGVRPDNLAYVLYTSGSTGRPKGVLIPHRNVASFFTGMDARVGATPGTWLAVTSVSFDISVLELLWTLSRGFKVAVQGEQGALAAAPRRSTSSRRRPLGFSLFYFAADDGTPGAERYRLLMEGARFADQHGFEAVWTPERHLHSFGGLYPSPALTSAAVAAITRRVDIRAGSVVLPLHHPVRVAEEWSFVDNLSNGRVGISVAAGWHANDFVLAPERYSERREQSRKDLDLVRRLWRGDAVKLPNGTGEPVEVRIRPSPVQRELPIWLTAAGNPDTFRDAGRMGAGVLTHLLGQRWEELRERIALYRESWREAGHPGEGHVTLMLHTFVGQDVERVRETVEGPLRRYLSSSADLMRGLGRTLGMDLEPGSVRPEDLSTLTDRAFARFFETGGLFGTPRTCREQVARIDALGVDEVACLIDFGVDTDTVLAHLPALDAVRQRAERDFRLQGRDGGTVPAQLRRHGVTHLQVTPSLAQALLLEPDAPGALAGLERMLVGGEALPLDLAAKLRDTVGGALLNMYGPTETTIWSSTHRVGTEPGPIPIGTPIANTSLYVLDAELRPAPIGVPGELFIGGVGVARGYHARPELTAERFLPDPFGGHAGARMYRTGDRARWRADGRVEFLGRVDHQLKVRGFRVEPGEIEAVFARHPGVRQAVVVAREDVPGSARLVAYVVPRPDATLSEDSLRAFARSSLPEHLVPSNVVTLDALPLTPNGKVDRKALPAPEGARASTREYVAPRTETERRVAELWSSLLGVPRVGANDDFFALGGHSLLATRAASRIRESFGVSLHLRELFEAATPAALAARIDALPRASGHQVPPLVPRSQEGALPLSFAQQRLWFLEQLEPGGSAYNEAVLVRVDGSLDVGMLERCLREVVRRHAILRATFRDEAGTPVQRISSEVRLTLAQVDLTSFSESTRPAEVERRVGEEALRPFDLASGPPLRAMLFQLDAREHSLLLVLHHLVSDGWSLGVLVREVAALYRAFSTGRESPLPEPSVQYVDFASWQREWLHGDALESQLAYWRTRLDGAPRALELPTDHPRPAVRSSRGTSRGAMLGAELSRQVKALALREGVTPFMVLLAGFTALLSRHGGQEDLCVGTPVSGRDRTEVEGLIGCFVNTLVLRVSTAGAPTFRELIGRARETVLGAFAHQDAPFEELVKALAPERDLGRGPLVQAMIVLQEDPLPEISMPGLRLRVLEQPSQTAKFDLRLNVTDTPEGFATNLEVSTDLFEPETASRLLNHLRLLLEDGVSDPERRVRDLSLMPREEWRQMVVEWNARGAGSRSTATVPALFEAQVARTPTALAVVSGDVSLTYAEVDVWANQVAWRLRELGVRQGSTVGLCLERSPDLIVGMLGILKAGAAYVPLDARHPSERNAWMLREAGVDVLLTQQSLSLELQEHGGTHLLLDADGDSFIRQPTTPPSLDVSEDALAYIMFTSGSTGRPKGVCVPHRGVVRLVKDTAFMRFGAEEAFLQLAPAAFDASTLEIWGALLNGARLVIAPPGALSLEELGELLAQSEITTLWLTAALFEQMVLHQGEALARVRQVLAGGDVLPVQRVREHLARLSPNAVLINGYGPTENTTFSATHTLRAGDAVGASVPIGCPVPHSTAYVLDEALRPVPVGVPGELYVGGAGLAWGYLANPELTAEKFVPHPFGTTSGERLYRTGDRTRWRPDGTLEFLGRIDFQVKVRGFRIEPGEVEAVLREVPGVTEAVVLAREDVPGDKRLVAYVVGPTAEQTSSLRTALQQKLPEYMVPSAFVALERLPLTPNGKVDRGALPAPSEASGVASRQYEAPQGSEEEQVAALFAELLSLERVGANDSFFELGGHSLLATRLVSRLHASFGVALPLRDFFQDSSVRHVAERVRAARQRSEGALPPIVRVPRSDSMPLSAPQERLWLLEQLQPGTALYNVPWGAWMDGALDVPAFERALARLFQRNESLRTTFASHAGEPVQVIHAHVPVSLPVVDLRGLPESAREAEALRAAAEEVRRPFSLSEGPLLRALLLRTGETRHFLVLTLHHIISDGWSLGVVIRELSALYDAELHGRPSPLPEPVLQPVDHAVWQRSWLQGESLEAQLRYWRKQLAAAPPVLELPTDFPRPSLQRFRGDTVNVELPAELSERFRAFCRREGVTTYMGLLAAFQLLLSRVSGQEDVCVGSPIAGRHHPGLERLIGFFVNTLVLRTRLDGNTTFRELLQRVRETTLDAYSHQDVPFEKLVEALQPPRSLSHAPLVQVVLALNEETPQDIAPEGLALRYVEVTTGTAKFDLTLSLFDTRDGLTGSLEFDADLFTPATAARLMKQLRVLLESAMAAPGQPVSDLPMMDAAERQRLLVDWNDTTAEYPREACLAALFEAQASRTPEAIAAECEDSRLTYGELDRRANQLAWYLRKRGVGPGTPVGLCVQRSLDLVVGMLGILKAGGAYVPLDPTYPRERLAFMVEDTHLPVVLAQRAVLELLPSASANVVLLDESRSEVAAEPESSPGVTVPAESLAYVMYTSGSTGRPKGVCIPQRAVARLVLGSRFARWGPDEVFLQLAPICFDAATFELWGALLHGAKLVLFPPTTPTVDSLKDVLVRHGVTTLWLTAALFEAISAARPDALDGVKQLLAGGDVLPPAVVRERLARGGVLVNGYGPTEGTTFSVCHVMEGAIADGAVPIGRPIANTRVYVVDAGMRLVPAGVPGELLIGGDGLAWGYLGRPELTAERFIPNPFGPEAGGRLYRTGDQVRYREDGTLEFLGRLDAQVKVRGYRVEPGEVEEALRKHPAVAEAVVVAKPDPAGGKRLVAYAVPRPGETLEPRALRSFLAEALPEFMVPSALVPLGALPLTPVGKLDRAALPEPEVARPAGITFVEPTSTLERQVAEVWAKVLGVERVGVEDHFFADLGGSSMSVVKACALLRDSLRRDVPATRFFEYPTVRAFAQSLERDGEPADAQDNEAHVDRAQQRRQALRRQGRRGNHGNG
ncbi:amino acid adenylation domain-containing protein [Pyxidicoccus parkwayensis]|uniref:Amino acid adenylation domain-containing protein n=1 Tax=Pyxidicoccus parkwayensis TaxID=2813578 RepID=A0ABX7P7C7_9BACT|nr:non-ribosomal peptide synthetase [Pyxidicoccus parkwaysis]QSQ26356.1 amino acid adenylation domain-containing protein [Pyxidicoccus parkwaysis]